MLEKIFEQEIKTVADKVLARVRELSLNPREDSPNAKFGTQGRQPQTINPILLKALRNNMRVRGMITGRNLDIRA